ncbi:MAG: hypothetical protein KJ949_01995 [Nanoarchaeota archaeon]|nr:hypothetical protein [Nanoarchaeota archaeon]MBU4308429.1 hypothetical protein [Nanoarchaeota archaeon]
MNLRKKKELASRTLGVGKKRITFVEPRLDEIKEAITKQDIRDLKKDGAIVINKISGRTKNLKVKVKRSVGNIRKKVNKRKKVYVILTRKLRKHVASEKRSGGLSREDTKEIRKKIRNRMFKSKAHLKEHIGGLKE